MHIEQSREIDAAPAAVWERLTRVYEWTPGDSNPVHSFNGPVEAGQTGWLQVRRKRQTGVQWGWQGMTVAIRVVEAEPGRRLVRVARLTWLPFLPPWSLEMIIEPLAGGRSRLRAVYESHPGWRWPFILLFGVFNMFILLRWPKRTLPDELDLLAEEIVSSEPRSR